MGRPGAALEHDPLRLDLLRRTVERSESYKFIRMADDFHSVASYLNDIRICFLVLTVTVYLVLVVFVIQYCVRRNRRNVNGGNPRRPRSQWEYQMEAQTDLRNAAQTDDLASVRSDGQGALGVGVGVGGGSYMGRNHRDRTVAPTFMRHGLQMNHTQQTTRLVTDHDGAADRTTTTTTAALDRERDRMGGGHNGTGGKGTEM